MDKTKELRTKMAHTICQVGQVHIVINKLPLLLEAGRFDLVQSSVAKALEEMDTLRAMIKEMPALMNGDRPELAVFDDVLRLSKEPQ